MIGKTDLDIFSNRLGEDLFMRGRKSRLAEGKVHIIIINNIVLKFAFNDLSHLLMTHKGICFFPSSEKQ